MARNGKKTGSTWTKKEGRPIPAPAGKMLPGKQGEVIGRSTPPWPISEFPPFRGHEEKVIKNDSDTPRK